MYEAMPWLTESDRPVARAWAEMELLAASAFADLATRGMTNSEGEPRKLLGEYRQLRATQSALSKELGLSPQSRASLGVDVARAQTLVEQLSRQAAGEAPHVAQDGREASDPTRAFGWRTGPPQSGWQP